MTNIIEKFNELLVPFIEKNGYEVVDVEYKKIYDQMNLTVFIYKKEGITLKDCEIINDILNDPLEEYDITNGEPYVLNVSSPGLDRELKSNRDLERNINEEVEVFFTETIKKKKKMNGVLISFDKENIKLFSKSTNITLKRNNIKKIIPYVKF